MTILYCWKQLSSWPSLVSQCLRQRMHLSFTKVYFCACRVWALRKEAWACSLKHLNLLLYSPTRHWTTHIHPCRPMSLASLVMSSWSVLMTRASNNLWWGKEIFQALPEWARSSQGGKRERRKNMYSWPENSHENLVLPPTRTSFHLILQS